MRTTITSAMTGKAVTFDGNVQGRVGIRLGEIDAEKPGVILERDELLPALSEVLGVLTIDKADLPIVTDRAVHGNLFIGDTPWSAGASPQALRRGAYDRLALAEYLEAHPPVDEQQVEAVARLLGKGVADRLERGLTVQQSAREIVEQGTRVEMVQS